jgi:hypothetical protein
MNFSNSDYSRAQLQLVKQGTDATPPAINMMIETWVHMVQAGRLPAGGGSRHQQKEKA